MGMAGFIHGLNPPAEVFKNADAACSRAAETGPSVIHLFREDDKSLSAQNQAMAWAGRIDRVLGEDRLFARCQRIMPIADPDGRASHYEILLGVVDDKGEAIPPASFIAAAERFKRMTDVDGWQIDNVFKWIEQNNGRFENIGGFAINLSGQSLNSSDFLQSLHSRLDAARFPLSKIIFEITETAAIAEFGQAETFMRQIRRYGCRFSLDDFGAGFSSYAYLKNIRADYLKIDGSFVRELATSAADYAMVKSMTEIGHSLNMKVVAEYVESEAILDKLKDIGVDYAQGYFVGKPHRLTDLS
jgi:EAL domain-containing protein (putative c-di-GMP-specific phosphodiesterase class I)